MPFEIPLLLIDSILHTEEDIASKGGLDKPQGAQMPQRIQLIRIDTYLITVGKSSVDHVYMASNDIEMQNLPTIPINTRNGSRPRIGTKK